MSSGLEVGKDFGPNEAGHLNGPLCSDTRVLEGYRGGSSPSIKRVLDRLPGPNGQLVLLRQRTSLWIAQL